MLDKILVRLLGGIWSLKIKCMKSKNRLLIRLYDLYLENKGSYIGYASQIKSSPIFPHGILGVFISGSSRIGENCVIFQHVTIGSNTLPDSRGKGSPTIGDNCYIGAGAKIIGNVNIGDNVRIGANCVVFQDIPSNSVVVTQAPRVVQKENINNKYYSKNGEGYWVYMENGAWILEENPEMIKILCQ